MIRGALPWRGLAAALLLSGAALPASASAQCQLCEEREPVFAETAPDRPLRIEIENGLDFDRLAVGGDAGGVVDLDPATGHRQLAGDLVDLGGFAVRGTAVLRGDPGRMVRVDLPSSAMLYTVEGEAVELANLESDLPAQPQLDSNGQLRFSFGGRLYVRGRSAGNFRGRIRISAEYE